MFVDLSDFNKKIKDKCPVSEIMSEPIAVKAFQADDPPLVKYLKENIEEFYGLSLSESNELSNTASFRILTFVGNVLIQDIINKNLLSKYFPIIFRSDNINEILVGRYAITAAVILAGNIKNYKESVQIIPKMLEFSRFLTVFYFYQSIYIFPDRFQSIKQDIKDFHLEIQIAEQIRRVESLCLSEKDRDESLVSWFKIIKCGIESDEYDVQFISDPIWQVLTLECSFEVSCYVTDAKWNAISAFCKKAEPEYCMAFLYKAIEHISSCLSEKVLHPSCISAIDVITNISPLSPNVLDPTNLQPLLLLMVKFPSSTFLHISVINFIEVVSKMEGVNSQIALLFVPILLNEAVSKENGNLWISAYEIIGLFHKASNTSKSLKFILNDLGGYTAFIAGPWAERDKLKAAEYG